MTQRSYITLAFALAVAAANGAAAQSPEVAELEWRTSAATDAGEQVSIELEQFYLTLYNTGNLKTRTHENPEGVAVEALARSTGVFPGKSFRLAVRSIFCDLNPRICKRDLQPVPTGALVNVTKHVGGYYPSEPNWRYKAGDQVVMPDYSFKPFTKIVNQPVPPNWSPNDYTPGPGSQCAAFGTTCEHLVRALNPSLIKHFDANRRVAALPVTGYATRFSLHVDEQSMRAEALKETGKGQWPKPPETPDTQQPHKARFAEDWSLRLTNRSASDIAIGSIEKNIVPIGKAVRFSISDPLFEKQRTLMELIGHPFASGKILKDYLNNPIKLLVVDWDFDKEHCDWITGAPLNGVSCNEMVDITSKADHATMVVGLIQSKINGRGMVGLNPAAEVDYANLDMNQNAISQTDQLVNHLMAGAAKGARVANVSLGIPATVGGLLTPVKQVEALVDTLLIVAAAGNENRNLENEANCRITPACFYNLPNVVTVVGIDRSPDAPRIWKKNSAQGSNHSRKFAIAAVADHVWSTARGNKLGMTSGTSIAAPQVTAAASLVISAAEHLLASQIGELGARLPPKVVKDRLIYTADVFPTLEAMVGSGGRLNTERAVNVAFTQLKLRDGREIIGRMKEPPTNNQGYISCLKPNGQNQEYAWWNIRRMVEVPERGSYVLYFHDSRDASGSRNAQLHRVHDCNLRTLSPLGSIAPSNGVSSDLIEFKTGDIVDYTSTLLSH